MKINFSIGKAESKEEGKLNYIVSAIWGLVFVLIVGWLWPWALPIKLFELWSFHGTGLVDWLWHGLPMILWGVMLTLIIASSIKRPSWINTEKLLERGFYISVWAGVSEEIAFRWLIFLSSVIGVQISNFLIFGWLGFGLAEWFQNCVSGSFVNWTTFGYLAEYLRDPSIWSVGAGMMVSNAFFRDGHKYQGWFGYTNSWFIGIYLFWVTFHFGLLAAIIVHFLYDMIIFFITYIIMIRKRRREQQEEKSDDPGSIQHSRAGA